MHPAIFFGLLAGNLLWELYLKRKEFFKKHPILRETIDVALDIGLLGVGLPATKVGITAFKSAKGLKKVWEGVKVGWDVGWTGFSAIEIPFELADIPASTKKPQLEQRRAKINELYEKRMAIDEQIRQLQALKELYEEQIKQQK